MQGEVSGPIPTLIKGQLYWALVFEANHSNDPSLGALESQIQGSLVQESNSVDLWTKPSELKGTNYYLHRFDCRWLGERKDSKVHMCNDNLNKKAQSTFSQLYWWRKTMQQKISTSEKSID